MSHIFFTHFSCEGHIGCSKFWQLRIKPLWTNKSQYSFGMMEHPLDICPEVEHLGFEVDLFPIFWETIILISKVGVKTCSSVVELEIRDGDTSRSSHIVNDYFIYPGLFVFLYEVEHYFFKALCWSFDDYFVTSVNCFW